MSSKPFVPKIKISKSGSSIWDLSQKINCSSMTKFMIWLIPMLMRKFKGIWPKLILKKISWREDSSTKFQIKMTLPKMMTKVINQFQQHNQKIKKHKYKNQKYFSLGKLTYQMAPVHTTIKNSSKTITRHPKHSRWNTFLDTEVLTAETTLNLTQKETQFIIKEPLEFQWTKTGNKNSWINTKTISFVWTLVDI